MPSSQFEVIGLLPRTEDEMITVSSSLTSLSSQSSSSIGKDGNGKRRSSKSSRLVKGRPSYLFSLARRPRRHVKKRSIETAPLDPIDEDKLSGGTTGGGSGGPSTNNNGGKRRRGHGSDGSGPPLDLTRAPKAALALFLAVCGVANYRQHGATVGVRRGGAAGAVEPRSANAALRGGSSVGTTESEQSGGLIEEYLGGTIGGNATDDNNNNGGVEAATAGDAYGNIEDEPLVYFGKVVVVPDRLSHLANTFLDSFDPAFDKPLFWHVPRSGGITLKRLASHCLGLAVATEAGSSEAAIGETELKIVEGLDGTLFANVDMSHPAGISRAQAMGVGMTNRVQFVATPYLYDAATLFNRDHRGFMVALFRHPIERAASLYYSMRASKAYDRIVGNVQTIEQYAKSSAVENNWMTRFLSDTLSGQLTHEHEEIAKEVIRTKCLVGLLRDKTESVRRIEQFFRWKADGTQKEDCHEKLMYWDWPGRNRHAPVDEGSDAWKALMEHNMFDLRLYEYAERIYAAQGKKLFANATAVF